MIEPGAAQPHVYEPGALLRCTLEVADPGGGPLAVAWELRKDVADDPRAGGDFEESVPPLPGAVTGADGTGAGIRLPAEPGKYRIFAYARNGKGSAATANLPVLVKPAQAR